MALKDFLEKIDFEVSSVASSDFEIEITETNFVPSFDDPEITYDNLDKMRKKCKKLESCVLYVDMRDSSKISAAKRPQTLARLYSLFVKSMIAAGRYYNGHIRNIIGDRVMVVFDKQNCFLNAKNTAVLMNTISKYIINKRVKDIDFKCGIGIDYGSMLITKAGAIRQGSEKEFYRSLVWLGKPANIASRLTDLAFKTETYTFPVVCQGNYYPYAKEWLWIDRTYDDFIDDLGVTYTRTLKHKDENFCSFFKTISNPVTTSYSPILITKSVYDGLKKENPDDKTIKDKFWKKETISVRDYSGEVYGGDIFFTDVNEI